MRPLDFYRLGLALASSASEESERRTAIGRLYYGLHHEACCRYFRRNPHAPPLGRGSRHTELILRFDARDDVSNEIHRLLKDLFEMRKVADYELDSLIHYNDREFDSRVLMTIALIAAQELLAALERYSPGEAPDGCDCPTAYSVG